MKRALVSLALSIAATLSASAAITSIVPSLGTVSGGDSITITVDKTLHSCPVCSPPAYLAEVTFGGFPARNVYAWDKTIVAVTPPNFAGTVDVIVRSQEEFYGAAKFIYKGRYSPVTASNYERILVPLALPIGRMIPGAFGSQFTTDFYASSTADYPVELFNDVVCAVECPQFFAADPPYPQIAPHSVVKMQPLDAGGGVAFLYYLQKTYSKDVHFALHAADISRAKENAGSEIGVVRESNFRGMSFDILNVPLDDLSRATLRVYDVDASGYGYAAISIYAMSGNTLLSSSTIQLPLPVAKSQSPFADQLPPFAGFGQMALPSAPAGRVRVHVEMGNTSRGWAFVTVTNNSTQLITTYRPE